MNDIILKKIRKPSIEINLNNHTFNIKKKFFNKAQKIYYYYSEYYKLRNFFIENASLNACKIGLSFFLRKEQLGICLFAHFIKKQENVFHLETFKKQDFNLKVKYFNIDKIINNNFLILNCRFFENEKPKREEKVKIYF